MDNKRIKYTLKRKGLTMKRMFDEFYIIPKSFSFKIEQQEWLEKNSMKLLDDEIKEGKDGYIVCRGVSNYNIRKLNNA